jgi:hypothetical protein
MRQVIDMEYQKIRSLEEQANEFNHSRRMVRVNNIANIWRGEKPIFGVGWACNGTNTIEDTEQFIGELKNAIDFAKNLNAEAGD